MAEAREVVRAERIPILPLRNSVLFPMAVTPINVGRPRSVRLVEDLEAEGGLVGVIGQRDPSVIEPGFDDLFTVGTLARVVRVIRINANSYSVVLSGVARFHVVQGLTQEPFMRAEILRAPELTARSDEMNRLAGELRDKLRGALSLMSTLPREIGSALDNVEDPGNLADVITAHLPEEMAPVNVRQRVLEAYDPAQRLSMLLKIIDRQLDTLRIRAEVNHMVHTEMTRNQRAYVLRQQLRAIREELGESPDEDDEVEQLRERLALAELPTEARDAVRKQLSRLAAMQPQSSEYQVARSYVETVLDLPWQISTPDRFSVAEVRRCLDEDHHGLEQVKKRIVEFAAVRALRRDNRSPILLFVGPPGVGKTSLGRSIARAVGRRYARIALGGVRDEAEVRGHRRTYVGALPGRILQALKKVGANNPVIVLDEIDKMGSDMRGDPASALLEALDPAQNDTFVDHYVDLPFDLSKVTFLATANGLAGIPEPLLDRLEVIEVPGYTQSEKLRIARDFLLPKQVAEHGLNVSDVSIDDPALRTLIEGYTREAGVRGLERKIAAICREIAVRRAEHRALPPHLDRAHLEDLLGPAEYRPEVTEAHLNPGVAAGLGASSAGGELLIVEVSRMPGKGNIRLTGSLGKVLEEAASTAVSFVRSRAERLHLGPEWLREIDLHVHIARARAVRDFAGLGAAIFCAVVSQLLRVSCRSEVAVLGELTLRGAILPVHSLKSMLFAAHRAGITELVLPEKNRPDVAEIPEEILAHLTLHYVTHVDQVLEFVLAPGAPVGRAPAEPLAARP